MRKALAALAIGASIMGSAASAKAWSWVGTCHFNYQRWVTGSMGTHLNKCSMPDGSLQQDAYWTAIAQHQAATGRVYHSGARASSDCTITNGDGLNEFALLPPNHPWLDNGAKLGKALNLYNDCWDVPYRDGMIRESDVVLSNGMSYRVFGEQEQTDNSHGRGALLHEMNHALGLSHDSTLSTMQVSTPLPLTGGTGETTDLFADEIRGLRTVYGIAFTYSNLFASPYRVSPWPNGSILTNHPAQLTLVTRGNSITRWFTAVNQGTPDATLDQFWYVRLNGTGPYIQIGSNTANWIEHENYWNFQKTLTIPTTLAPGTYKLVHWVVNRVSDGKYSDNINMSRESLYVVP